MKTPKRNDEFVCLHCQKKVIPANKTSRNHCPYCLYSMHVDETLPGDRKSSCHGLMLPTSLTHHGKKGLQISFTCTQCGANHNNKVADDDNRELLTELAQRTNAGYTPHTRKKK